MKIHLILEAWLNQRLHEYPTDKLEVMYDRLRIEVETLKVAVKERQAVHESTRSEIRQYELAQNDLAHVLLARQFGNIPLIGQISNAFAMAHDS